jgi:hypothetical protein
MCLRVFFQIFGMASTYFPGFLARQIFSLDTRVVSHKKLEFGLVLGPPMLGIQIPPVDGEKKPCLSRGPIC